MNSHTNRARKSRAPGCQEAKFCVDSVVFLRTGRFTLVHFGPIAGLGAGTGLYFAFARQIQAGLAPARYAAVLTLLLPIAIVAGSRALALAVDWRTLLRSPAQALGKRGLAFQGGLIAVAAAIVGLATVYRINPLLLCDSFALSLPLGHAIGRLACLSYGCCHGRPTRVPWAIRYVNPSAKPVWHSDLAGVPLHPTQLYQSIGSALLFVALGLIAAFATPRIGQLTAAYFLATAVGRAILETFRGGPVPRAGRFTWFQVIAFAQLACGLLVLSVAHGPTAPFASGMSLGQALVLATPMLPYAAATALVVALAFGIHGPKVGRL